MNRNFGALLIAVGLSCALGAAVRGGEQSCVDSTSSHERATSCVELSFDARMDTASESSEVAASGKQVAEISTRFRPPLLAHDWWGTTNYVDLAPGPGLLDYECGSVTYGGHTGNDIAIRDFVEQDEGRFVVAAAGGTVYATDDGYDDRQTGNVPGTPSNYIVLEHEDGSLSYYFHLKKWSVMVNPGQDVREGQPLGLVGSSGESTGPHLHFAVRQDGIVHEPHAGPCRTGDSLWKNQVEYVYDLPVELFHAGVTTVNPSGNYLSRPPDVWHVKQEAGGTTHYFWFRLRRCHVGDETRTIYRDPSAVIFREAVATCDTWYPFVTGRWTTVLPATGSVGNWTIEFQVNGVTRSLLSFTYDGSSAQIPSAVGRSVAVTHGVARSDLRGSDADSDLAEFRIVSPPAHGRVSLTGPRQRFFAYTPDSGFQGQDSFTFEVEDGQQQTSLPATMTMDVSPVVANTLRLEGEDDHVAVPDNGSLNLAAGFTLEAWVRRTVGSAGWQVLVDRRNPDNLTGYSLAIQSDSTLRLQVGTGTATVIADGTTAVPMDRWTHVAGTWDGQWLRLFVDGAQEPTPVAFAGPITYPGVYETWLGRSRTAGNSFRGEIDEIRIWSEARGEGGETCGLLGGTPPATLRGWWRFQGDASDSSGQGNHGSLVAPAFFRSTDGAFAPCAAEDTDADGHVDLADNCPLAPNSEQANGDGDEFGDACDFCPAVYGTSQSDFDRDGLGDACDLCPFLADTEQLDGDSDGTGDLCDPDPQDAGVAVPSEVTDLALAHDADTDQTTLGWTIDPHAAEYQVVRGSLEEIRARFYGVCRSGVDPDPSDTAFVDADEPGTRELFGYLVVGVAPSGDRGTAGLDPDGGQRDLTAKDCL